MRSIPEKTLEHWTSIYLSNRFPNGALWWPTSGEDVLAELPRLASSGPGKTLALELKTTEARGATHVLEIDTRQLANYLNPPSGPPLPVYYVFPTPYWTGPLTSRSGATPTAPAGSSSKPPEWWRRRVGPQWFGDWLHVLSARSLAKMLPTGWATGPERKSTLFTLTSSHLAGRTPDWPRLIGHRPSTSPTTWAAFWKLVTRCGPTDGVRWRTFANRGDQPTQVLVLDGPEQHLWSLDPLLDRPWPQRKPRGLAAEDTGVAGTTESGNDERVLLHIPDTALT
ncbi:hypothetical protein ACOBQX_11480 [Actinokineospora sp. G85]|uniref:hypothetical protein n=1 Tax=Actinokineospora sp. G85 TaxID=3406626 RepID=UPI003C77AF34